MKTQNLSNKSRTDLNTSLMKLYRHLTAKSEPTPDKEDKKSSTILNEETEDEDAQEIESEITPAIGIGI